VKLDTTKLRDAAVEILLACGESPEGSKSVADSMLKADMRGITTHGTYLLSPIHKRVQVKQLVLPTRITVVDDNNATAVVDGGDGLGAIAGKAAVEAAVSKAKKYGIGNVLIRNTNNIGSLACYTEAAAEAGMLAFMCCNAASAMAPWGGAEPYMGTNPIAIAIYTGGDVIFSADMASSVVARGKIRKAERNGQSIPDNWAMDALGNFTTDPKAALDGCLLPMGGPKGSAIALMVDIVSGILSGSRYARDLKSFHTPEGSTGVGAALTVINIANFMPLPKFKELITGYITAMKGLKKAQGFNEIYLPGEIEQKKEKQCRLTGVELDDNAAAAINELLEKIGSPNRVRGI
jgi:LDH2 family malate/lactate/ureidoglycolate dehydrogenase